jgi:predicted PurR-regulated permease PerM
MAEQLSPAPSGSPKWSSNTKLVAGLVSASVLLALLFYFRNIIGPLLLAFIIAFLFHPVIAWISKKTHISWRMAVNIIYILLLVLLAVLIAIAGLAIIQQTTQSLGDVEDFIAELPGYVQVVSTREYTLGPLHLSLAYLDLQEVTRRVLDLVQPALSRAGTLVGSFATGAANTAGWVLFILLVSYFLLSESSQLRGDLVHIEIPGYSEDIRHLIHDLGDTWNAFLRGQLVISFLIFISYYVVMLILGVRLPAVIALMAGLAAFIPYIGPFFTWVFVVIVAFFQPYNYFGLSPFFYVLLILGCCLVLNQVFDNLISPRILGQRLGVHPAAVLIAAIVATDLIGIIGLVLAAPVLATVTLLGRYIARKMLDLDPWVEPEPRPVVVNKFWIHTHRRLLATWRWLRSRLS